MMLLGLAPSSEHDLMLCLQKDSQESLDSPVATAAVKSAMDQRVLTGAFDDLAAKAAATAAAAAPSTGSSSDASAAEAALLEAWRSRQLSSDRMEDEVELGPMIGRGGFGQVPLMLPALPAFKRNASNYLGFKSQEGNAQHPDDLLQVHKARWRGALVSPVLYTSLILACSSSFCRVCSIHNTLNCQPCAYGCEVGTKVTCSLATGCREDCESCEE
jgi:hypothetical protein